MMNGWHRLYVVVVFVLGVVISAGVFLALPVTMAEAWGDLVRSAAVVWLLASVVLYGLGAGVAWTIRGFRKTG